MKNLRKSSFAITVILVVLHSSSVCAWNDTVTHPALTGMAVANLRGSGWLEPYFQNNLGFKNHVDEFLNNGKKDIKIIDLLLEGSDREDDGLRYRHHFHEPITNSGLSQGPLQGKSALAWARGDFSSNDYSWAKARQYYSEALFTNETAERDAKLAETFRSLGQIMHMIQDMAVPAHTRDDAFEGHLLSIPIGSNDFERFLAYPANTPLVGQHGAAAQIPTFSNLNQPIEMRYFWDADQYTLQNSDLEKSINTGLAEYSSANFLSSGRMLGASGFPHPNKQDMNWNNIET
jgi:hypothetical protein